MDVPKKKLMLEKMSDNGLLKGIRQWPSVIWLRYFQIANITTPVRENIRQWPFRKYQTMVFCYMV